MRQLDLFGSLPDTVSRQKTEEEKQFVSKNEEHFYSVSQPPEVPYSVVELSKDVMAPETSNGSGEIVITKELDKTPLEESEQPVASFDAIHEGNFLGIRTIEKSGVQRDVLDFNGNNKDGREVFGAEQSEGPKGGTVVFDNGKITVKVKNKPIIADISNSAADTTFAVGDTSITVADTSTNIREKETGKKEVQKRGRKSLQEMEAEADLVEVPDDEELFKKQYYPISQVAKWFRVNTSLLRFWENEFDILKPKKNRKGDRLFRPEDIKSLQLIYQLLRQRKYTIEGAKEYIKSNRKKADVELQLTNTLQKFKGFLLDLKSNLQT